MICPNCNKAQIKITNTYTVSDTSKTQRAECPACFKVFTLLTRVEVKHVDPARGQGASTLAEELRNNRV